jgi:isopentenyl diphosphate isomerase/L-lactate dehydrogenase-like FMN-dependent dehydrogenase
MAAFHERVRDLGHGPVEAPVDLDLAALEDRASEQLGPMAFAYYAGGAQEERLISSNVDAWKRWDLLPRVLVDVSEISTTTSVLGDEIAAPVIIAPTALHRMATPEGERATARAAAACGTIMTLSSLSNTRIEDVADAGEGAPQWMQVYILKDRQRTKEMVQRVSAAGFSALVLTVDTPVSGLRSREIRKQVRLPDDLELPNLAHADVAKESDEGFLAAVAREFDPSLTYDDVTWLAEISDLPVLVKGVARAADALTCLDAGAAGIIVSNHGGRQLDDAPPTAVLLPEIADALQGAAPVVVDGGVRSPGDVMKALSLGATAVQIGRPVLWSLATGGQAGVEELLTWFTKELRRTMALCGVRSIDEIDQSFVRETRFP